MGSHANDMQRRASRPPRRAALGLICYLDPELTRERLHAGLQQRRALVFTCMPDRDGEKLVDIVGESHSIRMRQRSPEWIRDPMHMKKRFVQKFREAERFFGRR